MYQNEFYPTKPHRFVMYGRTSSDMMNARGLDDQFVEIEQALKHLGCEWTDCGRFHDIGSSDRNLHSRAGFKRMQDELKSGQLNVDLVLVTTLDRVGRKSGIAQVCQALLIEYGVRVVAVESLGADLKANAE